MTPDQRVAAEALNPPLTLAEVEASIRRLGNNKSAGADGVASELLKNGGEMMAKVLHRICQIAWEQSEVPMDWLRGVIVPLHKDGDRKLPANYRPITLLSIVGKVYTGVLQHRLMAWSEAHGIIAPEQGGFRPGRGCPEQLFTLTELIKLRRLRDELTFACFIDFRKAYDTVWHAGMQRKLREYNITGPMLRALCSLYSGCESTVRLGGPLGYTDFFPIETGVRQGCILSPWLYSLFINDLTRLLKEQKGSGASIDEGGMDRLCALLYADDIVLLSDDEESLQVLMETVQDYAREWRFEVNHSKCGLMRFGCSGNASCTLPKSQLTIDGIAVPWVKSYKYLGVELSNGVGLPFREFRKRMLTSATRAGYQVAGMGMYTGKLSVPLGVQVYKALVRPLLEYAAEITSSMSAWPDAERLQLAVGKRILQCPTRTCDVGVRGELGWHCMESRFQQLRVGLWGKLQLMAAHMPARLVYEESLRHYHRFASGDVDHAITYEAAEGAQVPRPFEKTTDRVSSLWCAQLQRDLYSLGLRSFWDQPSSVKSLGAEAWRLKIKSSVHTREHAHWRREVSHQIILRSYRMMRSLDKLELQSYLTVPHGGWNDLRLIGRRALTQLRLGSSVLRINTGRWEELALEHRICSWCHDEVETEQHFLLDCCFRVSLDARAQLWNQLDRLLNEGEEAAAAAAAAPRFRMSSQPAIAQLTLLTGGGHPAITSNSLYRRVMSAVMIVLAPWMTARRQKHEQISELR